MVTRADVIDKMMLEQKAHASEVGKRPTDLSVHSASRESTSGTCSNSKEAYE